MLKVSQTHNNPQTRKVRLTQNTINSFAPQTTCPMTHTTTLTNVETLTDLKTNLEHSQMEQQMLIRMIKLLHT